MLGLSVFTENSIYIGTDGTKFFLVIPEIGVGYRLYEAYSHSARFLDEVLAFMEGRYDDIC